MVQEFWAGTYVEAAIINLPHKSLLLLQSIDSSLSTRFSIATFGHPFSIQPPILWIRKAETLSINHMPVEANTTFFDTVKNPENLMKLDALVSSLVLISL